MLNSALGEALVVEAEPSLSLPSSTHRAAEPLRPPGAADSCAPPAVDRAGLPAAESGQAGGELEPAESDRGKVLGLVANVEALIGMLAPLGFGYMYRATAEAGQPSAAFFALGGCAGVGFLLSLGLR